MNDALVRLIEHMRWADDRVADALAASCDAERANPDAEALRLFGHIASVEHLWYARIHGRTPTYPVWPDFTLDVARAVAAEHASLFGELLAAHDEAQLERSVSYTNSAGKAFQNSISDIVMHTTVHGEHHRGQIARLLRAAGHEPAYTDYIQFARRNQ